MAEFGDLLRGLGSVLNPEVAKEVAQEDQQKRAMQQALAVPMIQQQLQQRIADDRERKLALVVSPFLQKGDLAGAAAAASQVPGGAKLGMQLFEKAQEIKHKEGYTLGPDQTRYDAEGNAVAFGLPKDEKPAVPHQRNRIDGETTIQEEFDPVSKTWKEIGRGPRFAKQIAPAITLTSQGDLTPESVKDLAIQSLYDPNALSGYRRDPKMMAKIANERTKIMRDTGVSSEDVVSGRAGFKADMGSLSKLTPQYDAITAFEKTAIRNGDRLVQLAEKVDSTGVPAVERWLRAGKQATGDPDVSQFNAQLQIYRTEAARILTNPNLGGALTDTARKEMEDFLKSGGSAKQIKSVTTLLKNDFENRKATLEEQIGSIRARMRSRVSPGNAEPAAPAATAPVAQPAQAGTLSPDEQAELDALRKRFKK